jgi:hypothetical protein
MGVIAGIILLALTVIGCGWPLVLLWRLAHRPIGGRLIDYPTLQEITAREVKKWDEKWKAEMIKRSPWEQIEDKTCTPQ